jgi:hypothetical protein
LIVRRSQMWANARGAEATMRQDAVEDAMARILAGRMTRRVFLERAAALGLSASAAGALLAACSRVPSGTPTSRPESSAGATPARPTAVPGGTGLPEIVPAPRSVDYDGMVEAAEIACPTLPHGGLRDRLEEISAVAGVVLRFDAVRDRVQAQLAIRTDAIDLPPQGYRLEISRGDQGPVISIEASDEAGAFYGLLSMRQLIVADGSTFRVRLATAEDRPGFARRGAILDTIQLPTGGSTDEERARLLDRVRFGVPYKMNLVAHPNATLGHSQPWPELVEYCETHHVELLSLIGYRDWLSVAPRVEVKAYLKSQVDLGIRSFSLNWDDIDTTDPEALARDHAEIFTDLHNYLRSLDPGVRVAITMPPYGGIPFKNLVASDGRSGETYLERMSAALPGDVRVFWTGDGGVFSSTVTLDGARAYASLVGRDLALWDNDALRFAAERQPLSGRAARLPELISTYMGNLADPRVAWTGTNGHFALLTMLLYAWDPENYDPAAAAATAERLVG